MTHICVGKQAIFVLVNCLSYVRSQAIISTSAGFCSIGFNWTRNQYQWALIQYKPFHWRNPLPYNLSSWHLVITYHVFSIYTNSIRWHKLRYCILLNFFSMSYWFHESCIDYHDGNYYYSVGHFGFVVALQCQIKYWQTKLFMMIRLTISWLLQYIYAYMLPRMFPGPLVSFYEIHKPIHISKILIRAYVHSFC